MDKGCKRSTPNGLTWIDPVTGEELERTVAGLYKLEPKLIGKLKETLK